MLGGAGEQKREQQERGQDSSQATGSAAGSQQVSPVQPKCGCRVDREQRGHEKDGPDLGSGVREASSGTGVRVSEGQAGQQPGSVAVGPSSQGHCAGNGSTDRSRQTAEGPGRRGLAGKELWEAKEKGAGTFCPTESRSLSMFCGPSPDKKNSQVTELCPPCTLLSAHHGLFLGQGEGRRAGVQAVWTWACEQLSVAGPQCICKPRSRRGLYTFHGGPGSQHCGPCEKCIM